MRRGTGLLPERLLYTEGAVSEQVVSEEMKVESAVSRRHR